MKKSITLAAALQKLAAFAFVISLIFGGLYTFLQGQSAHPSPTNTETLALPDTTQAESPDKVALAEIAQIDSITNANLDTGNFENGIAALEKIRPVLKNELSRAWLERAIGKIFYIRANDQPKDFFKWMDSAIVHANHSADFKLAKDSFSQNCLGYCQHNLGAFYNQCGNWLKAQKPLEAAVNHLKNTNDPWVSSTHRELGNALIELGETELARSNYAEALRAANTDSLRLAKALLHRAEFFNNIGEYQNAILDLVRGEAIARQHDPEDLVSFQHQLGITFDTLGNYDLALEFFEKAIASSADEESRAVILSDEAITLNKKKDFRRAETTLREAMRIAQKLERTDLLAGCQNNLGDALFGQKKYDNALAAYQKSIAITLENNSTAAADWRHSPDSKQADRLLDKTRLFLLLRAKGNALLRCRDELKQGLLPAEVALRSFQLADTLLDASRLTVISSAGKKFWREQARSIYEPALQACALATQHDAAFYFMEKSKSLLLYEGLFKSELGNSLPDTSLRNKFKNRLQDLRVAIFKLEKKDSNATAATVAAKRQALEQFITDTVIQKFPTWSRFFNPPPIATLARARDLLSGSNAGFVHYFYGNEAIYVLCVSKNAATDSLLRIEKTADLQRCLDGFIKSFEGAGEAIDNEPAKFDVISHAVYKAICQPVFRLGLEKVTLIPDGRLCQIPFDALRPTLSFDKDTNWLIFEKDIRYAWSVSLLEMRQPKVGKLGKIQIFLPDDFENGELPDFDSRELSASIRENLGRPSSVQVFRKSAASAKSFRENAPNAFIAHIHSHATANASGEPQLYFYKSVPLPADSIQFIDLSRLDIAILSACETNIGQYQRGEGVFSLARSFAMAGAGSVVSSQWKVNEHHTKDIFSRFYAHLGTGKTSAAALLAARREFIAAHQKELGFSPHSWAAWVYFGADMEMDFGSSSGSRSGGLWWLVGGALLAFLLFFTLKNK